MRPVVEPKPLMVPARARDQRQHVRIYPRSRRAGADETVRKLVPAPPGAHWTEFPHGKRFPALEAPAELAAGLQSFFAPLS